MEGARNGKPKQKERVLSAKLWEIVDGAVSQVVDQTSFGDLARQWRESQGHYIPNWDITRSGKNAISGQLV